MPLTNYSLDKFISQQLSELTQYNAPEVSSQYPQRKFWVSNFSLNSLFGGTVTKEGRTFAFFFLGRAEAAFFEYEYACQALNEFVTTTPGGLSLYFKALHHFEMVISMMWQAYDLIREITKKDWYVEGDKYKSLNQIYNKSRHFNLSELSLENIQAIWLTNSGVKTEEFEVTYSEIESFLIEIGDMANELCKAGK